MKAKFVAALFITALSASAFANPHHDRAEEHRYHARQEQRHERAERAEHADRAERRGDREHREYQHDARDQRQQPGRDESSRQASQHFESDSTMPNGHAH